MITLFVLLSQIFCINIIRVLGINTRLTKECYRHYQSKNETTNGDVSKKYAIKNFKIPSTENKGYLNKLEFTINNDIWIFEDAEISLYNFIKTSYDMVNDTFRIIKLKDGSELDLNSIYLKIFLKKNKNVMIHDIKEVREENDSLVFEFINGQIIIIGDTKSYKYIDEGVYKINPTNDDLNSKKMCLVS